ncbi:hypothetical protein O9G_002067 [Rozella allomycis CSF55]|uniref:Uncharacterized protein n=1 Tax=Rozella allomycis (strain CSF55) TaxID=988480 RepID=A0A075B0K5_ROZAC|nr:hypothetical protein O9G_002067 [Rozella allomycis CSF55]|eukprot:EPZ34494.1 hypothetical protein O9G_002067 [Rozella allomycis CSF55]
MFYENNIPSYLEVEFDSKIKPINWNNIFTTTNDKRAIIFPIQKYIKLDYVTNNNILKTISIKRTHFPICPAHSYTFYRAQKTYTVLLRVKDFDGLILFNEPMSKDQILKHKPTKDHLAELKRIHDLSIDTKQNIWQKYPKKLNDLYLSMQ